jgi:hypothetical protein
MEEKTILLGKTDEIIYTLTLKNGNVSQTGYKDIFDYDQGEQRAREYLEDDTEMWKQAVASDSTTQSFDEWCEEVINVDGWEHVLGESVQEIDYSGFYFDDYNLIEDDGLPYDEYEYYDDILVEKEDFEKLVKAINEDDHESIEKIFSKIPEFNAREDLKQYV